MYQDIPTAWDAWDIDSTYKVLPIPLEDPATIEPAASGPLFAALRLHRRINDSTLEQEIRLRRGSRTLELHTVIEWHERHKLLKVNFPVSIHAHEAVHEIQFGHIRRPNHASRQFDADRFEVCNHKWTALVEEGRGCAVLNDCKYGINVEGNSMNLTLLKSALAPDAHADQGRQELTYAFTLWNGSLADSGVVREAYELNCPVESSPGAAGTASLFSVDAPNIVIETVKAAEDGAADIVVRMYEAKRTATRCALSSSLPFTGAVETDMLENPVAPLTLAKGKVVLDFRAFEVKTVKLKR
jgi:alpha-mannosidase